MLIGTFVHPNSCGLRSATCCDTNDIIETTIFMILLGQQYLAVSQLKFPKDHQIVEDNNLGFRVMFILIVFKDTAPSMFVFSV